jgi:hypothetical protein
METFTSTQSFKNRQSCGIPLARDEQGGGTNSDGSQESNVLLALLPSREIHEAGHHCATNAGTRKSQNEGNGLPWIPLRPLYQKNS